MASLSVGKICLVCNREFFVKPYRRYTAKYCSRKCQQVVHIKLLHSPESRRKSKIALMGLPKPWQVGKKKTIETRRKMSVAHLREKAPNWQGGITAITDKLRNNLEYRLWRDSVFARDNWTCQSCGQHGGDLEAHHIKPFSLYPDLRLAIDNGKTLCLICHKLTDTWGNKISNIRKDKTWLV